MASFLSLATTVFGTITLGFGVHYIVNPAAAIYNFSPAITTPTQPNDVRTMKAILLLFGAKDVFVGIALLSAVLYGRPKMRGILRLALGLCAAYDGYVMKNLTGTGEWNHWGYGSMQTPPAAAPPNPAKPAAPRKSAAALGAARPGVPVAATKAAAMLVNRAARAPGPPNAAIIAVLSAVGVYVVP
ncbi:hypothetical protein BDV96DRAFT_641739 [Lophiotrema nucula]|uniref:Uncharacterized protein n=1 Tax=Lophiotrema nucula TaxID=690887 RepID=A0A6A5ZM02_9PLEO|nr:hypothetical protein BDV96DRAFT_641739 [Lophiotrema nucula]